MPIKIIQVSVVIFCLTVALLFCNSPTSPQRKNPAEFLGSWVDIDTSSTNPLILSSDSLIFFYNGIHYYCYHIYENYGDSIVGQISQTPGGSWVTINDSLFISNTSYQYTLFPDSLLILKKDTVTEIYYKGK